MITERITALADAIETRALPLEFDMGDVISDPILIGDKIRCNTAACLAGWACILFGRAGEEISMDHAAQLLGLSIGESQHLFLGHWTGTDLSCISREQAVRKLRRMAKTGTVVVA